MQQERRNATPGRRALRNELNEQQLDTLRDIERFGWDLQFIRRPLFQPSLAFVYDSNRRLYALLEADGTLNESHGYTVRTH